MSTEKKTDEKTNEKANETSTNRNGENPQIKKIAIYAVILLVVFLLGFVPMWLTARGRANDLAETQRQLKVAQMQNVLATAVIDARRGEYEPARQLASDFFTSLRAETAQEDNSALTQAQRENIRPLFEQRDEIITLLSRGDPASAERLSSFYDSYSKAMGGS